MQRVKTQKWFKEENELMCIDCVQGTLQEGQAYRRSTVSSSTVIVHLMIINDSSC